MMKKPEDEILAELAIQEDLAERGEDIARARRPFWANEILLGELSARIDQRKRLKRWTKTILNETLERVLKVIKIRKMLTKIVDESVAKSDTKARETIAAEAQLQEHIKVEIQPPTPTLLIVKTQTNPTLAKINNTGLPTVEGWGGTPSPCPGGARAKITGLSTVVGWGGATQPPSRD